MSIGPSLCSVTEWGVSVAGTECWVKLADLVSVLSFQDFVIFFIHISHKYGPEQLGQSYAPSDWYSGGCGFDPLSGHNIFRRNIVMN